jgi:hypothetical protein
LLRSPLFQVDPLDPVVLVLTAISIFLLALAASVMLKYSIASRKVFGYPAQVQLTPELHLRGRQR